MEFIADLIIPDLGCWNSDLVHNLFPHSDAALILATPLSWRLPPNKMIWHYDVNGVFFVKSAYKIAFNCRFEASSSTSVIRGTPV